MQTKITDTKKPRKTLKPTLRYNEKNLQQQLIQFKKYKQLTESRIF